MGLRETLQKLDRRLDGSLESLPDVSSQTDRERYRAKVKSGAGRVKRRAGATIRSLDELGDKYAGKLRPKKGGWDRLIDYSTANPLITVMIIFVLAGAIATQAINIPKYMRGDMEIYLPPDDPSTKILTEVRVDWSTDVAIIYVKSKDWNGDGKPDNITDYRTLQDLSHFEGDDDTIDAVNESDRGIDYDKGDRGKNDKIVYCLSLSTIVKELNSTPPRLAKAINPALPAVPGAYAIPSDQSLIDQLVNSIPEDQKASILKDYDGDGIYDRSVIIVGIKAGQNPTQMVAKIDKALKHLDPNYCTMVNTGPYTVIEKIQGRTIMEFIKIMPFMILYLFAAMFFFHRTFKAPLIGLIPCALALAITYGMVGALKDFLIISPQIALVAPCLLALGISYGIYITNRYTEEKKGTPMEKARVAAKAMHPAILLSAATTAIGFASLMIGTLPPIAVMGLALSVGIVLTYVLTMILTPALTVLLKYKKKIEWKGWRRFGAVPSDHRKKTLLVFILVVLLSAALIPTVKFNADYLAMAPTDDPAFTYMNEYSKAMGGGQIGMVIVRGDVKDVNVLRGMDTLGNSMNKVPNTKVMSVVDIMKMIKAPENITLPSPPAPPNTVIHLPVNVSFWQAINSVGQPVVQEFLINTFYETLSPEMRGFLVNDAYSKTLIYVFQPMMDIEKTRAAVNGVNSAVDESNIPGARVSKLTGVGAIQLAVNDLLISGTLTSTVVCIFLSFCVLLPVFRSWKLSLFTIIPCCIVVSLEPLVLVGMNIPLSIVTVMIGSIAIGTGVDFSIQISQRVRLLGISIESVKDAVENNGISFVEATTTMVLGFMAVLLSPGFLVDIAMGNPWTVVAGVPIQSVREFVVMIQILLALNALSAIFILPAIYTVWLRFREQEKKRIEREGW